ncbi:hypothetical protein AGLY_008566 [Aphis glycines]|uniref:Uncharacterized protein n=1 Tax=Aphis glycines TaxID=307491 RepID=A0A6G0TLM6_APHGL|nr:hypothetical protein AGLY_008566 [Aphis glycines]
MRSHFKNNIECYNLILNISKIHDSLKLISSNYLKFKYLQHLRKSQNFSKCFAIENILYICVLLYINVIFHSDDALYSRTLISPEIQILNNIHSNIAYKLLLLQVNYVIWVVKITMIALLFSWAFFPGCVYWFGFFFRGHFFRDSERRYQKKLQNIYKSTNFYCSPLIVTTLTLIY